MFNIGDTVETVGTTSMTTCAEGTKAVVTGYWYYNCTNHVTVDWIITNTDGTPVLNKYGEPLTQCNGGYFNEYFRLVKGVTDLDTLKGGLVKHIFT